MKQVTLTIGHNVGSVEVFDTPSICQTITEFLHIDAFTALPCIGMWKGMPEHSTRIEIVTDESSARTILGKIPSLAAKLNQEAIMCESHDANVSFPAAIIPAAV